MRVELELEGANGIDVHADDPFCVVRLWELGNGIWVAMKLVNFSHGTRIANQVSVRVVAFGWINGDWGLRW